MALTNGATELATALVRKNEHTIRYSYVMDDVHDAYNNGIAGACEDAVCLAYGFTPEQARQFMRITCREV